jgi:hypothetical protein
MEKTPGRALQRIVISPLLWNTSTSVQSVSSLKKLITLQSRSRSPKELVRHELEWEGHLVELTSSLRLAVGFYPSQTGSARASKVGRVALRTSRSEHLFHSSEIDI